MHRLVSFNGQLVDASEPSVGGVSSAALYGRGVFTTVAIREGRALLWESHWSRVNRDADTLNIDISGFSDAEVREDFDRVIEANKVHRGKARLTFFDGSAPDAWPSGTFGETSRLIQASDVPAAASRPVLGISRYGVNSTSPLAGVKSCNYLESLLAIEEARSRGFDEAIRLNEKARVTSGCLTNVFWISRSRNRIETPPLTSGCLSGTTREFVIGETGASEHEISLRELLDDALAVFVTSAVRGVCEVAAIEDWRPPSSLPSNVSALFP